MPVTAFVRYRKLGDAREVAAVNKDAQIAEVPIARALPWIARAKFGRLTSTPRA